MVENQLMLNRSDMSKMRVLQDERYLKFMMKMGPTMVSFQKWKSSMMVAKRKRATFSSVVSVSDEAFCIFAIENSWVRWLTKEEMLDKEDTNYSWEFTAEEKLQIAEVMKRRDTKPNDHIWRKKQQVKNKYSGDVRKKHDGIQGTRGWTNEGIQRYNDLRRLVAEDRKVNGDAFDQEIDEHIENMLDNNKSRKRKVGLITEESNDIIEDDELEVLAV
jgi:hypothetical protein